MPQIEIKKYLKRASRKKKSLTAFSLKLGNSKIHLGPAVKAAEQATWKEVPCTSCANCCKKMTPTFNRTDINRISKHFALTPTEFVEKWLEVDDAKDHINKSLPCQFLGKDNRCTIYEIRPRDCMEFPHFDRRDFKYQAREGTFTENMKHCPATVVFLEKLQAEIGGDL